MGEVRYEVHTYPGSSVCYFLVCLLNMFGIYLQRSRIYVNNFLEHSVLSLCFSTNGWLSGRIQGLKVRCMHISSYTPLAVRDSPCWSRVKLLHGPSEKLLKLASMADKQLNWGKGHR